MEAQSRNILLTYEEVAAVLRISVDSVKMRVKRGTLSVERFGGSSRVPLWSLPPTAQARALEILAEQEAEKEKAAAEAGAVST